MDLDETIDVYHQSVTHIVQGDPEPLKGLYSQRDDATLSNPWGPSRKGWADIAPTLERAAAQFRDGSPQPRGHEELTRFVDGEIACLVTNERWQAKVSGREEISPFELRVTTIFRREDGGWKVAHRHADPITTENPDGPLRPSR